MLEVSDDPEALNKLREARKQLAEATSIGSDPYAEDAESLPEEVMQTLKAAYSLSGAHIQQDLQRNALRVRELYSEINIHSNDPTWLAQKQEAYVTELNRCITAIRKYRVQLQEYLKMG